MAELEWHRFFPPAVEVRKTDREELGRRGLYAKQKILRGTEILRSEPFVCVLDTDERENYCNFCLKAKKEKLKPFDPVPPRDLELKKCSQCKFVWYCGKECQRNDWHLHKSECKVLTKAETVHLQPQLLEIGPTKDCIQLTRLLIRMQKKNRDELTKIQSLPEAARLEVDLLHPNHGSLTEYIEFAGKTSSLVTHALGRLQKQMDLHGKTEELLELYYKLHFNGHGICNQLCEHIGFGIYTGPSLLNHSCDPNCYRVYEGPTFILRAVKTIQPGEQLCISYISMLTTYKQRQAKLWDTYHFRCQCHRCVSECQQTSPYHIMYAATGDISKEEKEAMMDEGFSTIEKVDKLGPVIEVCQRLIEKYKEVLHPANILILKVFNKLRRAYTELQEDDSKILEALKMVIEAYRHYPFKLEDYDYGMQLLDLGTLQLLMGRCDHSRKTFTEAVEVLSVVVGLHHPLTILARKGQDIATKQLHLSH